MKVRSINIPDLFHFKELYLDLTYPAGHPKEGKPLDKVCIIGQSGTGKTTLLKLISVLSYRETLYNNIASIDKLENIDLEFDLSNLRVKQNIGPSEDGEGVTGYFNSHIVEDREISFEEALEIWSKFWDETAILSMYFPAELDYNFEINTSEEGTLDQKKIIDFSIERAADIWKIILSRIQKYQEDEIKIRQEISKVAEDSKDIKAIQKAVKKLENWRKKDFNPVEDIAENCLDPLLKNFGLRVKTKLEFQKKEDIGFLKIEDFSGNEVPNGLLSTGTKQALLSALPLYMLKPKNSQILYDEPERSLYPDLQRIIIDYYVNLTEDCQFFFATHSPIIAASFEPWEIVELKFDSNWNVYRDKYYEGENHVDNYYIDPRYLDFDLILTKVFDLKDTNTDIRTEAIVEATMLKNQLNELKKQNKLKTKQATELYNKYRSLAKKLAWNIE